MSSYAHPEILIETNAVAENPTREGTRVVEVDYDPTLNYEQGHIQGSVLFDWKRDINNPVERDIVSKEKFEALLGGAGITNDTNVILYGDFNNWFAAFAFWVFKIYGHEKVQIMNGGRKKWIDEDRPLPKDVPSYPSAQYTAKPANDEIRAYYGDVKNSLNQPGNGMVDVRGPKEFSGEILAPAEYPTEHAQRGGHIPGAQNIPWAQAVNENGTFRSIEELKVLYEPRGITGDKNLIAYCRIGERSSHTWVVLKYLLGYPNVKNYDASWTEWGNMLRNPIEKEQFSRN